MSEGTEGTADATIPQGTTGIEGLPSNFKNVGALADSYNELQKSFTQVSQKASQMEKAKGFNWGEFSADYYETGQVNQQQYNQLIKAGHSEQFVNDYLQGQSALMEQKVNNLYQTVGGKESYEELLTWAGDNLDDASIDAFNNALQQGEASAKLALQGIASQYQTGNNLSQQQGDGLNNLPNTPNIGIGGFESQDQVVKAINDPRYQSDDAYREAIQRKLANTTF